MIRIFAAPGRYVQGYGVLNDLYHYIKEKGDKFLVIGTKSRINALEQQIVSSFGECKEKLVIECFGGESTWAEIRRIGAVALNKGCNCIVGVGAGKTMDTAKAAAYINKCNVIIVPTAASSDAPCSSVSVIYTEEGVFEEVAVFDRNPEMVILDSQIIANAGARLLSAGMGDALATYFEARTCVESGKKNCLGGFSTKTSWELAKLCHAVLIENGTKAILAAEKGLVTLAVEDIIEANTLLSGVGFESNGVSTAHSVYYGFTVIPEHLGFLHGEFVAFGVICQLIMENRPSVELDEIIRFCISVGLPVSLADLKMDKLTDAQLELVAKKAVMPNESIHNEPFPITARFVKDAIQTADRIGNFYKSGNHIVY
jgi:glycerol dehydrogenase